MTKVNKKDILKSGNIVVMKGGSWSKLIKGIFSSKTRNFYLMRSVISLITLSRYTHTGTLIRKRDGKWYIVQALLREGVTETEVHMPWFDNQIEINGMDVFRDPDFNREVFNKKLKTVVGSSYWVRGLFNIALFNISGKSKKVNTKGKFFCSHLTSYLHDLDEKEEYYLNSPADVADSDYLRKII